MSQKVVNIEVASYQDCMNTGCNVMAVCCLDDVGQYAVYVGVVRLAEYDHEKPYLYQKSKDVAAQQVMHWGQKQTEEQARKYFSFPTGRYRD